MTEEQQRAWVRALLAEAAAGFVDDEPEPEGATSTKPRWWSAIRQG